MNLSRGHNGFGFLSPAGLGYAATRRSGSFTSDVTSTIALPQNPLEWEHFQAVKNTKIGMPNLLHLCQDVSGNAVSSVNTIPLPAAGTPIYQQAVAGWSAKALVPGFGPNYFSTTNTKLPDVSKVSIMSLILVDLNTITLQTQFPNMILWGSSSDLVGNTAGTRLALSSTSGNFFVACKGNSLTGANTVNGRGVIPFVLQHDVTNGVAFGCSDKDALTPTYLALPSGQYLQLGPASAGNNGNKYPIVYAAHWWDQNAEAARADIKTLLVAMGFTITWT